MAAPDAAVDSEKNCRACTDFKTWAKKQGMNVEAAEKKRSKRRECPLDSNRLGYYTWSFLHTMAAYYPEKPTVKEQDDMKEFIDKFSKFYPCEVCATDFRESIKSNPPNTTSRNLLSNWFCERHNEVNRKLNKPEFDCSRVLERWLYGWKDGSCDRYPSRRSD
ncbi:FAD-linked sulfhydryl oxidase ALR-like [Centruroides vittatus]|uniref:FAD-linked sulfhydryl oxidase ALR-like n=1 Tax=Centruroides vittatus TaxID=120091 RepID=UPI00350EF465